MTHIFSVSIYSNNNTQRRSYYKEIETQKCWSTFLRSPTCSPGIQSQFIGLTIRISSVHLLPLFLFTVSCQVLGK